MCRPHSDASTASGGDPGSGRQLMTRTPAIAILPASGWHCWSSSPWPSPSAHSIPPSEARSRDATSPSPWRARRWRQSRRGWTATPCWSSTTRGSATSSSSRSPATSASSRTRPAATSPERTSGGFRPQMHRRLQPRQGPQAASRATTGGACSISATGCGTPTARIARCRRSTRCCPGASWSNDGRRHRVRRHARGLRRAR